MRAFQLLTISAMSLLLMCESADAQNMTQYQPDVAYDCYTNSEPSAQCRIDCWDQEAGDKGIMAPTRNVARVEMFFSKAGGKAGGRWWMFVKRYNANNGVYTVDDYSFGPNIECRMGNVVAGVDKSQNISGWKIDTFNWGR